ncbi:MAG TPA: peroxidase family protein [Micromonosporaceae bacterium]|jgi:hypothetical protein
MHPRHRAIRANVVPTTASRRRSRRALVLASAAILLTAGVAASLTAAAAVDSLGSDAFTPLGGVGSRPGHPTTSPTRAGTATPARGSALDFPIEPIDGRGNNATHPTWGASGQPYLRVAPALYADGIGTPVSGPNARYVSNRVMNDLGQNVFSERRVSQWGWTWGQFLDHTFGLAADSTTKADIPFDAADPLEDFTDTLGVIPFSRTGAAAGTGTSASNPRQQVNTNSSYINAFAVYGGTDQRLDWLRAGPLDGDPTNNSALLLLPEEYLPTRDARGDAAAAPTMALDGRLLGDPDSAMVAGDVRANENLALTATQTLFAREHNRIVSLLPDSLSEQEKFEIARRIVVAEQQYITYNEWLPAMGVALPRYTGYKPDVNPSLSNEFATVGYRAHSQIHGEFEFTTDASRYTAADLAYFRSQAVEVTPDADQVDIAVPLNVAFFNPALLQRLQLGPFLSSLLESQYNNDEQIDNQLRSVLFQVPVPDNPGCGAEAPACFTGVEDLGALDLQRGRDNGIPRYNDLRKAYGLAPKTSFTAITGESTSSFPAGSGVDNPNSLDILSLTDIDGNPVALGEDGATHEVRRSSIAARLQAIYGNVNNVDAFVGMMAEPHVRGTEFGELQLAMWTRQFQALRDGDRFFYGTDSALAKIRQRYGIDYRTTLGQVIAANTDVTNEANRNVFLVSDDDLPPTTCTVTWTRTAVSRNSFQVGIRITNTGPTPVRGWSLGWQFANGQTVNRGRTVGGTFRQTGANGRNATVSNARYNGLIAPGASIGGIAFTGTWDNVANAAPPNFTLNNHRCATGSGKSGPQPRPRPRTRHLAAGSGSDAAVPEGRPAMRR